MLQLIKNVPRLAGFYKQLLSVKNGSDDEAHQFIISEGTALTVNNDGTVKTFEINGYGEER